MFWDDYLPPAERDSGSVLSMYQKVNLWQRPGEGDEDEEASLFGAEGVLPNGVTQGNLGDCWFLASAAALAEFPYRIKRIF